MLSWDPPPPRQFKSRTHLGPCDPKVSQETRGEGQTLTCDSHLESHDGSGMECQSFLDRWCILVSRNCWLCGGTFFYKYSILEIWLDQSYKGVLFFASYSEIKQPWMSYHWDRRWYANTRMAATTSVMWCSCLKRHSMRSTSMMDHSATIFSLKTLW